MDEGVDILSSGYPFFITDGFSSKSLLLCLLYKSPLFPPSTYPGTPCWKAKDLSANSGAPVTP